MSVQETGLSLQLCENTCLATEYVQQTSSSRYFPYCSASGLTMQWLLSGYCTSIQSMKAGLKKQAHFMDYHCLY